MKVSDSSLLGTTEFKFNLRCDIAGIFQCHTVQPLLSFGMPTFSTGSRVGLRFFLLSVCRLLLSLSWFFSFPHSPLRWDNVWVTAENSDGIPCRRRFCCCRFWYWLVPVPFHTLRYVVCSPYALCICVCVSSGTGLLGLHLLGRGNGIWHILTTSTGRFWESANPGFSNPIPLLKLKKIIPTTTATSSVLFWIVKLQHLGNKKRTETVGWNWNRKELSQTVRTRETGRAEILVGNKRHSKKLARDNRRTSPNWSTRWHNLPPVQL